MPYEQIVNLNLWLVFLDYLESIDLLKFMIGLSLIDTGRRQREELLDEVAVDEVTLLC